MTPSAYVVNYLASKGLEVRVHDPLVSEAGFKIEMEAQGYHCFDESDDSNKENISGKIKFIGDDYQECVKDSDCIVILTECD